MSSIVIYPLCRACINQQICNHWSRDTMLTLVQLYMTELSVRELKVL